MRADNYHKQWNWRANLEPSLKESERGSTFEQKMKNPKEDHPLPISVVNLELSKQQTETQVNLTSKVDALSEI